VLVIGIGLFFFGSLAASLAQSFIQLIVFRAFMGVSGGGLMSVAQMLVSDIVPLRERGKYQDILVRVELLRFYTAYSPYQGSVVAIAHGIGPVVGGALASQGRDSW
jgi:MFS family permease